MKVYAIISSSHELLYVVPSAKMACELLSNAQAKGEFNYILPFMVEGDSKFAKTSALKHLSLDELKTIEELFEYKFKASVDTSQLIARIKATNE